MKSPNIKKDADFVLKVLNNPLNKEVHRPALKKLIGNLSSFR